jgi:hypothetical protein
MTVVSILRKARKAQILMPVPEPSLECRLGDGPRAANPPLLSEGRANMNAMRIRVVAALVSAAIPIVSADRIGALSHIRFSKPTKTQPPPEGWVFVTAQQLVVADG